MIERKRRALLLGSGAAIGIALARPAIAQGGYPSRTIKIIAPVQPGGGVDLVARTLADRLGAVLNQSIIVDNQSGGGGVVGSGGGVRWVGVRSVRPLGGGRVVRLGPRRGWSGAPGCRPVVRGPGIGAL